jgi:hypothetical protein
MIINILSVFILCYLTPLFMIRVYYKQSIRARMFFWFSVAITALIFNNNLIQGIS